MALSGMFSVGIMLYAVYYFGLSEAWPELVLNTFYVACLVMIWMYFFNYRITTHQFNYWCSISIGITVLLRDILFPPPMANLPLRSVCFTLSVLLLCTLTYFYARKEWQTYTKKNLMNMATKNIFAGIGVKTTFVNILYDELMKREFVTLVDMMCIKRRLPKVEQVIICTKTEYQHGLLQTKPLHHSQKETLPFGEHDGLWYGEVTLFGEDGTLRGGRCRERVDG